MVGGGESRSVGSPGRAGWVGGKLGSVGGVYASAN
jgi:hypothetical protein